MNSLEQEKEMCNKKYKEAIVYARHKDIKNCRNCLFDVMYMLLHISHSVSDTEKVECENKISSLLNLAKSIADNGFTDEVMFNLTGELPSNAADILDENNDYENPNNLENIEKIDENLPKNDEILEKNEEKQEINEFKESKTNNPLRPLRLKDYIGQDKIKKPLAEAILAARTKNTALDHTLLFGSAGLGKTTLARIIANEMKSNCIVMNGPTIKDVNDFLNNIKSIKENDVIFIDEIHRLGTTVAEAIYSAMEDFKLAYIKSDGKNVEIDLPKFTLIGATTHSGLLEKPMRDRFPLQFRLENYSVEQLFDLGKKSFLKLGYVIEDEAMMNIAKRSRGVPRICNGFIKRICDKALIRNTTTITNDIVNEYFAENGIDEIGLNEGDILLLKTIIEKFKGGPVGIDTLASATGEGKNIIENQYEPYLVYLGFINITPSGRVATELAYKHLKM